MIDVRALVVAGLAALAACHYARGVGAPDAMPEGHPMFAARDADAYWIWEDDRGWHLRTSSDARRRFHGVVESLDGKVDQVRPVGSRGVTPGSDAVAFDWRASGAEQGFDWASSDGCVRFELYIDEDARPLRVFLGGVEQTPARMPFAVCR